MLPVIWILEIQKSGRLDLLRATHGSGPRIIAQWHNVYWRTMALSIGNQAYACSQNLSPIINCNASNYHSDQRRHWQRRSTSAVCHCHHCHCLVTKSWSKAMAACILNPHHDNINIILITPTLILIILLFPGDRWLVQCLGCLYSSKGLFYRVVPADQGFHSADEYAGIFR